MIRRLGLKTLLLSTFVAYIMLGVADVPLHGDEATAIWTSRDFQLVVLEGNFAAVAYHPPPQRNIEQHERIMMGNFSRFWMGIGWWSMGLHADDLNQPWVWSPDLDIAWHQANGHIPADDVLLVMRLINGLMVVISLAFIYKTTMLIAQRFFHARPVVELAAWSAALLYVTNPIILLNGRRAMFEGGFLVVVTAAAWWIALMVQRWELQTWRQFAVLGVLTGVVFSTKHSTVFTIVPLYVVLLGLILWRHDGRRFGYLAGAGGLSLVVMLILWPLWWSDPLAMPGVTYEARQDILQLQIDLYGGYDTFGDQLQGLFDETLVLGPQYYEADFWGDFAGVQAEIDHYNALVVSGLRPAIVWTALRAWLIVFGVWALVQNRQQLICIFLAIWLFGVGLLTLLTVPLNWQRYYLPLQLPLVVLMGIGVGRLWQHARRVVA